MNNFIMVHGYDTDRVIRVNKNLIECYCVRDSGHGTMIIGSNDEVYVRETPEEIDAMIEGVVYDPDERL